MGKNKRIYLEMNELEDVGMMVESQFVKKLGDYKMDIKRTLLEMVNSETSIRYSYMGIEKLILTMLDDYMEKQGKSFLQRHM
jgi:hypothetical protein